MRKIIEVFIGITEVVIGLSALIGVAVVQATGIYGLGPKPLNVYIFVVVSACMSFILGVGLLGGRTWAKNLLLFFSGYIILTKILRYGGLLTLNADIINAATAIPVWEKDAISFLYHFSIILFLSLRTSKR